MITYRLAVADDIDPLVSLLAEIMLHHGVTPPPDGALRRVVGDILAARDHCFLVAVEAERIVAMCALIFSHSTWSASLVCELQDVVVTASCRRRNVGRGLLETAEALAGERGCSRLFLSAESWNLEAQRFYRSLGLAEKTYLYYERDLLG
ncbi:MAG: GNAT family N-acetyltransferase [Chloroflexi bacterium]|nr:GNAT family N-acetyltransferase [Chloroflexota bacterium]